MTRIEKNVERRNKNIRLIIYLVCLFITSTSLIFAKMVNDENINIRETVNNNREIPLHIKEELGLR